MKYIFRFFKSKYLIASAAFGIWLFFFDSNDLPTQISRQKELNELKTKIGYYKDQVKQTGLELQNLQSNNPALEKYAREKYFMKRDNEEVFIIEQN